MTAPVTTTWPPAGGWQHLLTKEITVQHEADDPDDDTYGNPDPDLAAIDVVLGYLEPIAETIHLDQADTLVITHQVILPPQILLTADDTIVVDGVSYRVIEALHVSNARTGIDHHVEGKVVEIHG